MLPSNAALFVGTHALCLLSCCVADRRACGSCLCATSPHFFFGDSWSRPFPSLPFPSQRHTLLIGDDGKVQSFGCNDEYALGRTCVALNIEDEDIPKDEAEGIPGYAEGLEGVTVIHASAGDSHSFVLTDDGRVFGAGCFRDPSGSFAFSDTSPLGKAFVQVFPVPGGQQGRALQMASGADHVVILVQASTPNHLLHRHFVKSGVLIGCPRHHHQCSLYKVGSHLPPPCMLTATCTPNIW